MEAIETKEFLTPEDTARLEEEAQNLRDKLLIRILRRTGARVSEIINLETRHIQYKTKRIEIEHLKQKLGLSCPGCGSKLSKKSIFCPGCGIKVEKAVFKQKEHKKMRQLPIDQDTLDLIKEYIDRGGAGKVEDGRMLLFPMTRQNAWLIIKKCAKLAGLPELRNPESGIVHHVSPHKMRDSFAIAAVKHNEESLDNIRLLQEHLGHESYDTTMKYRKVGSEEHSNWFNNLIADIDK